MPLREFQLVLAIIEPPQAIEVSTVVRIEIEDLLDQLMGVVQLDIAISQHVAQVIQRRSVIRIHFEQGFKLFLSFVETLRPLEDRTVGEQGRPFLPFVR